MTFPSSHAALMDSVYRRQRHLYDATRKYYLLGRDRMVAGLAPPPGGTVLEIGCGTGRNLLMAARLYPEARFHGLDISEAMLDTARRAIRAELADDLIVLASGDASDFVAEALFGRSRFDRVYFSYALSMIPDWEKALAAAVDALAIGGSLHIVDFGQQEKLPRWFRSILHGWLRRFHVEPRAMLAAELAVQAERIGGRIEVTALHRGYAWHAVLHRGTAGAAKPYSSAETSASSMAWGL